MKKVTLANENKDISRALRLAPKKESAYLGFYVQYQDIINDFGRVLVQVDDDDYQGDTRVLLEKGGKYGFLNFGWGSCSGCDALQACNDHYQLQELIDDLERDIKWFTTLADVKAHILDPERAVSYYYHVKEWQEFRNKVEAFYEYEG